MSDPRAVHDALVGQLDGRITAAGIIPVTADGLWFCQMRMPKGPPVYADFGGKRDPGDRSLWDTAVREAREEGGLDYTHTLLTDASQIFYSANKQGVSYVFFFVPTSAVPVVTGDARILGVRHWTSQPPMGELHQRMRFATGFSAKLATFLQR